MDIFSRAAEKTWIGLKFLLCRDRQRKKMTIWSVDFRQKVCFTRCRRQEQSIPKNIGESPLFDRIEWKKGSSWSDETWASSQLGRLIIKWINWDWDWEKEVNHVCKQRRWYSWIYDCPIKTIKATDKPTATIRWKSRRNPLTRPRREFCVTWTGLGFASLRGWK